MLAAEHPKFSVSYLQRKLRIGYPRAARIADQLEQEGYGEKMEEGTPPV
jgi:DNA segregation ATPase FtsK/SpoIIIE-like protein